MDLRSVFISFAISRSCSQLAYIEKRDGTAQIDDDSRSLFQRSHRPPAITSIEQPAGGGDLKRNLSSTLPRPDHPTDRLTKDMADEEEPPWNEKGVER